MVFQSYALYPHMSVYDNISYGLRRRGLPKAEIDRARRQRGDDAEARSADAPTAGTALRWAAPARRARPRHRPPACRVPDGRAAQQPRRQAPGRDARRAVATAQRARRHHRLRHPRPGRSDDHGQPHRGHEPGPDRADRPAARRLPPARSRLFVARFLGLPEINIFTGAVLRSGSAAAFDWNGRRLALPVAAAPGVALLGLRPQALHGGTAGTLPGARRSATAASPRWSTTAPKASPRSTSPALRLRSQSRPARTSPSAAQIAIYADLANPHLFDPATGRRIEMAAVAVLEPAQ